MANVLLGVTGSVAAIKTPELFGLLRKAGYTVRVVATQAALYFFEPGELTPPPSPLPETERGGILLPSPPASGGEGLGVRGVATREPALVTLDEDEWPGRDEGARYARSDKVLHIELRKWADLLLIAPLDANTLGKLALGLCDNCLTCVWRAWDRTRPAILAPAMNTLMWEHPATARHLMQMAADWGSATYQADALDVCQQINRAKGRLHVVGPIEKILACNDEGIGAMAEPEDIVAAVQSVLPLA